jgi:hypothetical protein
VPTPSTAQKNFMFELIAYIVQHGIRDIEVMP